MAVPRTYWQVTRGDAVFIFDLYGTINRMYTIFHRYQMSPRTWEVIQAFIEELRFATEPNLGRWPVVPQPTNMQVDPLTAEEWLLAHGSQFDLIDLTNDFELFDFELSDTEPETDPDQDSLATQRSWLSQ